MFLVFSYLLIRKTPSMTHTIIAIKMLAAIPLMASTSRPDDDITTKKIQYIQLK